MEVGDTLGFLLGRWSIRRSLVQRDGGRASFVGTGTYTEHSGCDRGRRQARYEEVGELVFASYSGAAGRSLHYAAAPGGGPVAVHFSDGRPFVDLDLSTGSWTARHPCAEDEYEIATRVLAPDVLEERWRVRGPTKSYDAVTTMARLA